MVPKRRLGELFALPRRDACADHAADAEVNLATCLRRERYSYGCPEHTQVSPLPESTIVGAAPTLARLTAIATGIESAILGERFITTQVTQAFRASAGDSPLGRLGSTALLIARELREAFSFYALEDYDDIALRLLCRQKSFSQPSRQLVIVGGGMLASALCAHRDVRRYAGVFVVTRSPKKLRKKLSPEIRVCTADCLRPLLHGAVFDCILATTQLTPDYAGTLRAIWSSDSCLRVIDLSSAAVVEKFGDDPRFISAYDACFDAAVSQVNRRFTSVVPAIRRALADRVTQAATALFDERPRG